VFIRKSTLGAKANLVRPRKEAFVDSAFENGGIDDDSNIKSAIVSDVSESRLPYPRALLRRVLTLGDFGPGTRVLDVGCGLGLFAQYLDSLGLDVIGLDGSESNIDSARLLNPDLKFDIGFIPREQFLTDDPDFELIFARSFGTSADGNWERSALLTISTLIGCLRADGVLVIELDTQEATNDRNELANRFDELTAISGRLKFKLVRTDSLLHAIVRR
jgi:SAM-dependent methyltransferase